MNLNRLFLLFCLLFIGRVYSQGTIQFRGYSIAKSELTNGVWSDWSAPKTNNTLFVFDLDNQQIKMYNELYTEKFQIINSTTEEQTDKFTLNCVCIDMNGVECTITCIVSYDNKLFLNYGNYVEGYGISRVLN